MSTNNSDLIGTITNDLNNNSTINNSSGNNNNGSGNNNCGESMFGGFSWINDEIKLEI